MPTDALRPSGARRPLCGRFRPHGPPQSREVRARSCSTGRIWAVTAGDGERQTDRTADFMVGRASAFKRKCAASAQARSGPACGNNAGGVQAPERFSRGPSRIRFPGTCNTVFDAGCPQSPKSVVTAATSASQHELWGQGPFDTWSATSGLAWSSRNRIGGRSCQERCRRPAPLTRRPARETYSMAPTRGRMACTQALTRFGKCRGTPVQSAAPVPPRALADVVRRRGPWCLSSPRIAVSSRLRGM